MKKTNTFLLFFVLFSIQTLQAQTWSLGLAAGGTSYNGDMSINLNTFAPQMRPALGLLARFYIADQFVIRGQVNGARLYADEKKYPTKELWEKRGFNFQSQIVELNAVAEWRPFKNAFQPYIYGGMGGMMFDSQTFYNEPNSVISSEDIAKDKKASYAHTMVIFPVGAGFEYLFNEDFSIGLDLSSRISTSDYIDGLSKLTGSKSKDSYFIGTITFSKLFDSSNFGNRRMSNRKVGCPTF
jgi:hypothetical protein